MGGIFAASCVESQESAEMKVRTQIALGVASSSMLHVFDRVVDGDPSTLEP